MMLLGFLSGPATAEPIRSHAMPMLPDCGMACCQAEAPVKTCCEGEKQTAPPPQSDDDCPCFMPGDGSSLPAAIVAPPLSLSIPAILSEPEIVIPQPTEDGAMQVPALDPGHPIRGPTLPSGSRAPPLV